MTSVVRPKSLIWYVVALAAAISVPLLLVSVLLAANWVGSERARLREGTSEATANAVAQIDRYIAGRIAMLQALATSPAFDARDFRRIDAQARELLDLQGSNIVLRELDGQQRVNTRFPWGADLPRAEIVDVDRQVLASKAPAVSDFYFGTASRAALIRIVVPILRAGDVVMTLTASLPSPALQGMLRAAGIAAPLSGAIADRHGVTLARDDDQAFVGQRLAYLQGVTGNRGIWSGDGPDGVAVEASFQRSPLSGWIVAVGIPRAVLDAPLRQSIMTFGILALALCGLAAVMSMIVARHLIASHREIARAAGRLGLDGGLDRPPVTAMREVNRIGEALFEASTRLGAQASELARANQALENRVAERTRELRDQADMLSVTLDNMDQGLLMIAADGTIPVVNRRALDLLDLPAELMASRPRFVDVVRHQMERDDFERSEEMFRRWVADCELERVQYERTRPNGTVIEVRTVPLVSGGAVRTFTDITERRRREAALQSAEAEYRDLFENAVIGIYRSSPSGRTLRANPALARINGFATEQELLEATSDLGREWYVDPGRRAEFLRLMRTDGRVTDFESEICRYATKERIWISETAWTVHAADGAVKWFEGTVQDITNRRRAEAEIRFLASHDALTGLANRAALGDALQDKLQTAAPRSRDLALLYLDLDRFKTINDTLGHAAGNALLSEVAGRIREVIGVDDMAARLGGDEFVVVQSGSTRPDEPETLARRLIDVVGRPYRIQGRLARVGLSVGIAAPRDGEAASADQLLADADVALYRAKSAGRNTFVRHLPGMDEDKQARRALELDLGGAIERSELFVQYQPAMKVDGSRVASFEALVRWRHPVRGVCPPDTFIPLAEETGLIVDIGDWVLRTACREAASWPNDLTISVNISGVQLTHGDVRQSVILALAQSGLAPERLELEITESVLMGDSAEILETLQAIRGFGVRIALDDFGTGFSSLGYLRRFRFDKIKIDRSFVADIDNPDTLDIIRAIVSLGARRRMTITAEGVETREQLAMILAEDCTEAQGYLISRPLPADKVGEFLSGFVRSGRAA